jgi:hypothetical protein
MDAEESAIAEQVSGAFNRAYNEALAAGLSVLVADNDGDIVRVSPDGKREFVKHIGKTHPVVKGSKFHIR